MTTLSHRASIPAKISQRTPVSVYITLFIGGVIITIICVACILGHLMTATPIHFMWFIVTGVATSASGWEYFSDRQRIKHTINTRALDLIKVTEAYWSLNKNHRQMARPVMDRLVIEYFTSDAFKQRAARIYALRDLEAATRPGIVKDDIDLHQIDAYLDLAPGRVLQS